jgi:hypothetical protein
MRFFEHVWLRPTIDAAIGAALICFENICSI